MISRSASAVAAAALAVAGERKDPFVDGHPTTVTVVFDGRVSVTGVLQ